MVFRPPQAFQRSVGCFANKSIPLYDRRPFAYTIRVDSATLKSIPVHDTSPTLTLCVHGCVYVRELFTGFKGYGALPIKIRITFCDGLFNIQALSAYSWTAHLDVHIP